MNAVSFARGLGAGWRRELALFIERRSDLGFVEVMAEDPALAHEPALARLRERGVAVVVHGVSLSLGSAEAPDRRRLRAFARLAQQLGAPLVSEHLAFVRGGGLESGHLLPVPRTREALRAIVRNVRTAQACLPVPLALENIASLFEWPGAELDEADFLAEVLEQTGALLLLDLANLHAGVRNHGLDAEAFLARLPLQRVAYVHLAGGCTDAAGFYHDTHAHALPAAVLGLLQRLCARCPPPAVMLERDDRFPADGQLHAELDAIAAVLRRHAPDAAGVPA